jgi:hypothetical protein
MRRLLALAGFALIACSQSQPAAGVSPSPGPTPPATASTPSQVADHPVIDFSCRLPVVTSISGGAGVTFQGGFVTFPGAQLAEDPAGRMQYRSTESDFATTAAPVLHGAGGFPFYDRAKARWVPVPAQQAKADGSAYAYTTTDFHTNVTKAYIVTVASGSVRAFNLPSPERPQVVDFGAAGVYVISSSALGGPGQGVWLLHPGTGAVRLLRDSPRVWAVRDGYAWVARFDSRDKTVWAPSELAPANSLVRINLATGAEKVWFYRAGRYPWFLGLDSLGRPVLLLGGNGSSEVRLIEQPGSAGQVVYSGDVQLGALQGDGERLWFGGEHGIYLFRPNRGLQKVFAYEAGPKTGASIQPAGFCI